ncbi:MAG: tetratricopeptide repeat protein [Sphingobacteriales bacterium]
MVKKILFISLFVLISALTKAQVADTALLNKLGDFDVAALNGDNDGAVAIGEQLLTDTPKMQPKARISFFAKLAKAYESTEQDAKATFYYEKVAAVEPNYYVAQRALGYLYNDQSEEIQIKLYLAPKDSPDYKALFDNYNKAVRKSLPYLEKALACDPDDDTLDLVKTLYMNIHDDAGLNSLVTRLPDLKKNCVDLLSDK